MIINNPVRDANPLQRRGLLDHEPDAPQMSWPHFIRMLDLATALVSFCPTPWLLRGGRGQEPLAEIWVMATLRYRLR